MKKSFGIISSCIKTVASNASSAVRSVAASVSPSENDEKEQVLWAGFDKLELSPTAFKRVLLLGYVKGFQVFNVEDVSGLSELVSRSDGPVSFLQILPAPLNHDVAEKHQLLHPILAVVVGDKDDGTTTFHNTRQGPANHSSFYKSIKPATVVRFYSMKSNDYVKNIDFKSAVLMVRCSSRVVGIGLKEQIHCLDTATLEKKFTITTYPVPLVEDLVAFGINRWYGPLATGPRWLAYPPPQKLVLNTGRLSSHSLATSVSQSSSPQSSSLARCAVDSSKHLAAGMLSLGEMGYKKLAKYGPGGSNSTGRKSASESENAGWIAVHDLVSRKVISHFRAHSDPVSALCFDPSGTLLVTASVSGKNVNIYRIKPISSRSGSDRTADWSDSYVHLYELQRGLTTAVIQDICFSQSSQWIAVVSSRGTCHIFTISPFGGNDGLQVVSTSGQSLPPWGASASFATNEQNSTAPLPCTPSEATCIKFSDTGLLNSVTNAAASVAGKTWVPSGAVAAMFHNTNCIGSLNANSTAVKLLEHILVYTPSGFLVQHEILSCTLEWNNNRTESWSVSQVNARNVEVKVKVKPTQWWDVRRGLDNLQNDPEIEADPDIEEKKLGKSDSLKSPGMNWYLSNAEMQLTSSRVPLRENPKFCVMEPPKEEWCSSGEFEIEKTPSHEIEKKRTKGSDLIMDHFKIGSYKTSPDERSRPTVPLATQPNCYDKTVDLGNLFDEGYYREPEMHDRPKTTEVVTDEVDNHVRDEEKNPGGMFYLFEEG